MIFNSKHDFEKYLDENGLVIIGDYPSNYIKDQRNYKLGVVLSTNDLAKYHLKLDFDAGFPIGVL
jgi:hypothetical protein